MSLEEKSEVRLSILSRRLGAILRHWTETRFILSRFFRGSRLTRADCSYLVSAGIMLFLSQVEPLFWARLDLSREKLAVPAGDAADPVRDLIFQHPLEGFWIFPFKGLTAEQTRGFWIIFLAVCLANAWILDRWLSRTSGEDATVRAPILALRRLLLGVPWLGLCVFPAWQIFLDIRPSWAFRKETVSPLLLDLSPRRQAGMLSRLRAGLAKVEGSAFFVAFWLVPINMFALRAGLAWFNVPERTGFVVLLLLAMAFAGLHFLGFACSLSTVILLGRERQLPVWKWGLFGLSCFLWLLPLPIPLLSLLSVLRIEGQRFKTILHKIHESRPYPQKLKEAAGPGSERLPWPLRGIFGGLEPSEDSIARYNVLKFYRAKTFLLLIDTGSVMLFLMWLEQNYLHTLWLQLVPGIPLILLIAGVTIGGAVGLIARTYAFLTRTVQSAEKKRDQDHYPVMRYLMLTSLAFAAGFVLTSRSGDPQAVATSFLVVGTLAFIFSFFFLLPAVGRYLFADGDRDVGLFLWPVAFQAMAQLGYFCRSNPEAMEALSRSWNLVATLIPLWALLLFAWRGHWLARPFKWGDIFDDRRPRRVRWALALMLVTAALPLSGLAIPYWIRARRRLESQFAPGTVPEVTIGPEAPGGFLQTAADS